MPRQFRRVASIDRQPFPFRKKENIVRNLANDPTPNFRKCIEFLLGKHVSQPLLPKDCVKLILQHSFFDQLCFEQLKRLVKELGVPNNKKLHRLI